MIEKNRARMRFVGIPAIKLQSELWQSEIFEFKNFLRRNSNYQLLDSKVYWQCDADFFECLPLLAVIGAPNQLEREVKVINLEAGPYWVHEIPSVSIYDLTFVTLKTQIISVLKTIPPQLAKIFHLVVDDEKIELHFFLEKDYIG